MSTWTTGQSDVILELGFKGVQAVHDEILDRFGVEHTLHAIEMQASRIHASLKVQTVCPECGTVGLSINRQTGLCPKCSELMHLANVRALNEQLQRERDAASNPEEIAAIKRENAKYRQRNSRLRRQLGAQNRACDVGGHLTHDEKTEADIQDGGAGCGDEGPRADQR